MFPPNAPLTFRDIHQVAKRTPGTPTDQAYFLIQKAAFLGEVYHQKHKVAKATRSLPLDALDRLLLFWGVPIRTLEHGTERRLHKMEVLRHRWLNQAQALLKDHPNPELSELLTLVRRKSPKG